MQIFKLRPWTDRNLNRALYLGLLILMASGLSACEKKETIKIGFSGCQTGRLGDLGIAGRNAVMMAVDEINKAGGIGGRHIELLVKDDRNDPETAVKADQALVEAGVAAIIGHMTSSMSREALPVMNAAKIPLISPTSTTNRLTGLDDFFFRVTSPDKIQSNIIAEYAYKNLGLRKIACIYDLSNREFTEQWFFNFKQAFMDLGGEAAEPFTFRSGEPVEYYNLSTTALNSRPGGVLIIAGALNTALFSQQIRKSGSNTPILSSGWAGTQQLIQHGGSSVEGVVFPQVFNKECKLPEYIQFKKKYQERFGKEPNFASVCSYEAARYLFSALDHLQPGGSSLKESLLSKGTFKGLQGNIKIDRFGDADRSQFIITVKDGEFVTLTNKTIR